MERARRRRRSRRRWRAGSACVAGLVHLLPVRPCARRKMLLPHLEPWAMSAMAVQVPLHPHDGSRRPDKRGGVCGCQPSPTADRACRTYYYILPN
eukprot:487759-Prymnesium_polylepis.1